MMERAIDWVLFIGIFIVFPTLAYQIHAELPDVNWFTIALVSLLHLWLLLVLFFGYFLVIKDRHQQLL